MVRDEVGVDVQPHGVREHGKGTERPRPVVRLRGPNCIGAIGAIGAIGCACCCCCCCAPPYPPCPLLEWRWSGRSNVRRCGSVGVAAITVAVGVAAATAVPPA